MHEGGRYEGGRYEGGHQRHAAEAWHAAPSTVPAASPSVGSTLRRSIARAPSRHPSRLLPRVRAVGAVHELGMLLLGRAAPGGDAETAAEARGGGSGASASAVAADGGESFLEMAELRAQLVSLVLCDFRVWARAALEVQLEHARLLRRFVQAQRSYPAARCQLRPGNVAASSACSA